MAQLFCSFSAQKFSHQQRRKIMFNGFPSFNSVVAKRWGCGRGMKLDSRGMFHNSSSVYLCMVMSAFSRRQTVFPVTTAVFSSSCLFLVLRSSVCCYFSARNIVLSSLYRLLPASILQGCCPPQNCTTAQYFRQPFPKHGRNVFTLLCSCSAKNV